jgi:KUP system potassium uptake protein
VVWSLTLVVSVKYLVFVMQADNRGEGGLFALLALLPGARSLGATNPALEAREDVRSPTGWTAVLVMVGAALLYGDGMITPTISVLSAMEGLKVADPALAPAVLPMTCGVLLGLFALQSRGPGAVGRLFGPIMVLWFLTLAGLGLWHVAHFPGVLEALNPMWAGRYFARHGLRGATILGAVVLAVTGGEALYADMGQFGRGPIRLAWFALAMPSLVLNYFGQGALILREHTLGRTPFFGMVPPGGLTLALVVLSTAATVIASQALISGAFSMTHQAIQLGFLPRLRVMHTSQDEEGQVYVPAVNVTLAIACVLLALIFRESSRLAAAYGIAVTGTMVITSLVYFEVTRKRWKWSLWLSLMLLLLFLSFDVPFAVANLFKIREGGYVPTLGRGRVLSDHGDLAPWPRHLPRATRERIVAVLDLLSNAG